MVMRVSEITMTQVSATTMEQCLSQKCCAGCGAVIAERFYSKVYPNQDWHNDCLRCSECNQQLTSTCFSKSGRLFCRADYLRVFSIRCAKCGDILKDDEYVMRAKENFYHIDCFSCTGCSKRLNMGDFCAVLNDGLYCRVDFDAIDRSAADNRLSSSFNQTIGDRANHPTSSSDQQKPLTIITNSPDSSAIIGSPPSTVSSLDTNLKSELQLGAINASKNQDGNNNTNGTQNENSQQTGSHSKSTKQSKMTRDGKEKKTTRVRTVLNEKQLHTLRACYAANPRPDALMKDQLVEMTQLSPRVIRVWFQNKRCKDKKRMMMLKQIQQQQHEKQAVLQRQFQTMPLVGQQGNSMIYETVGDINLTAADMVAVQTSSSNVSSSNVLPNGGGNVQIWNTNPIANPNVNVNVGLFAHPDMIGQHVAENGNLRASRPLIANEHHNDPNVAFSHMHLLGGYPTHDDDTIVSMDGDRSCYSR